jgi:hypothetical protein
MVDRFTTGASFNKLRSPLAWNQWQTSPMEERRMLHEASISFESIKQDHFVLAKDKSRIQDQLDV